MAISAQVQKEKFRQYLPAFIVMLILIIAYRQVILGLIGNWSHSEDNSHGFLILPIFAYMLWRKKDLLAELPVKGSNFGGVFLLFSACVYVLASAGGVLTLASLSLLTTFVGCLWFLFGAELIKNIAFPLLFLFFMIPIPEQIYASITGPLQLLVSQIASFLLKASSVPIVCQGNVIEHPEKVFQVVQACSGLRSIMTMLTLGAIVGYFSCNKIWLRVLLILIGIPIAIIINILRVYVLISFYDWLHLDLSVGTPHTLLGLGVFLIAIGLFFLIYRGAARWDR